MVIEFNAFDVIKQYKNVNIGSLCLFVLGGSVDPQTTSHRGLHRISADIHICSDLQPSALLHHVGFGAHLSVGLTG